jgi:hypothetical protein
MITITISASSSPEKEAESQNREPYPMGGEEDVSSASACKGIKFKLSGSGTWNRGIIFTSANPRL